MVALSSKQKGDLFEDEVFEFFKDHVMSGDYFLNPSNCTFFKQKGYYSKDRQGEIKFDITIEVHAKNREKLALLLVIECKNLSHPVDVDDIEEFNSKLCQVSGHNVKGIFFTKIGYRRGALKYASSTQIAIALARLLPEDQIDWVLERTPKAVSLKDKKIAAQRETINALTVEDYRGQSEAIFGLFRDNLTSSFPEILDALVPSEYMESVSAKKKKTQNYSKYIPYLGQEDIERRVSRILDYFKLDIRNKHQILLTPLCEFLNTNNNIKFIFDENLGKNPNGLDILGKITFNPNKIYVSNTLEYSSPRWRFTLAHEIGHFLLHRKSFNELFSSDYYDTDESLTWGSLNKTLNYRIEWQANSFASSLLLPRDLIISVVIDSLKELGVNKFGHGLIYLDDQKDNIYTYQQILFFIKREFNVSLQAINYRLAQLKILNNQQKKKHIKDLVKNIPALNDA